MIQPLLTSGKEFDCIIANNDAMALGAIEACKDAGVEINFPIVGIDCTADGAKAVQDGDMAMTVFQNHWILPARITAIRFSGFRLSR